MLKRIWNKSRRFQALLLALALCSRLGQSCTPSGAANAASPPQFCEVAGPPCQQQFDNTANSGTSKDAFIIYKIGEGKKDYPLSSNFQPTDPACWTNYKLYLSGTSTESSGDYPEISLVNQQHTGAVTIRINYTQQKFRDSYEVSDPKFDIQAQGKEALPDSSQPPPQVSPVAPRLTFQVKFVFCQVLQPASAQGFDNSANGGSANDAFIMYKLGIGKQEFTLSSPFQNQDQSCWIRYTLVLKGGNTDATSEYPELSFSGQKNGVFKLSLNYPDYSKYRVTHEQTNPEFEISAQGHEAKAWDSSPQPYASRASDIARLVIQVRFVYPNCILAAPAAAETFDNTANGGTASDAFIIYGYVEGSKDFRLTQPFIHTTKFMPGDSDCWIKYTLVNKGTDTDVIAQGSYPGLSLVNADNNGLVTLRINYNDLIYRTNEEQTDPEFEIKAQGHEPKKLDSQPPPELSAESASVGIKIKFNFCIVDVPAAAQSFDNTAVGGSIADPFVFYKLPSGASSWPLSSPFLPRDTRCQIKYTIVKKGTDTNVVADGSWPELSLKNEQKDGNVKFQMNWATYQWRPDYEQAEPEFEIIAQGYEPKDYSNAQKSKITVRTSISVKFYRLCALDVPAAAQAWDNTANGGTSSDDFMIYKLISGSKSFTLTSPFRHISKFEPGGQDCWIKYTLVHKDTDTDVIAEGKWPQITIHDGNAQGFVSISLDWPDFQWRSQQEQTEPQFEILAQGHEPKALNSLLAPELSPVLVRQPFKIKFYRDCLAKAPAQPQSFDNTVNTGSSSDEFVIYRMVEGQRDWTLSSPFQAESFCQIQYKLVLKGTDTDAAIDYPELSLVDGDDNGFVTLRAFYTLYKYRENYEQSNPEFEIVATAKETALSYGTPSTARFAIQVRYYINCVQPPALTQEFDNTANEGTAKDSFIIYGYKEGRKDFALSSPFQVVRICTIKYSLIHKGTNIDVIAEGNYPEISLVFGNNDSEVQSNNDGQVQSNSNGQVQGNSNGEVQGNNEDNVSIRIDYTDRKYRPLFEQADPEFEIMATGYPPQAQGAASPPQASLEVAYVAIQVKFRFCVVKAPTQAQQWNNQSLRGGKRDSFVIYELPSGKKSWQLNKPFKPDDTACFIKYTLVHKGTDIEIALDNSYPDIMLVQGNSQGYVSLQVNYSSRNYRKDYEQTDPEFDIVARGQQPVALDNDPPPEYSPISARFTVQVKFTVCFIDSPAAAQEFDNQANGGTSKDTFIIYRVPQGSKTWSLSSPFRPRDTSCFIHYSLVYKDTSTDVVAEGKWPEISIIEGTHEGAISFNMNWAAYKWRADFESTEPEFQIVALGHEPIDYGSVPAPYKSKNSARMTFKVKFYRLCVLDIPAEPQKWNNYNNGGTDADDFIIYKVFDGKKSFRLTSPFVHLSRYEPGDQHCEVNYKLVHKGTDTDVIAEGNWPEIKLESPNKDGKVTISLEWKEYKWRQSHEATEPEFEIIAQGRQPTDLEPELSLISVRLALKIKFIRQCVLELPASAQSWDNTKNGGTSSDSKIIYKLSDLEQNYKLSSPFKLISNYERGNLPCWIHYKLVYQGTDTDALAAGEWPELTLTDNFNDGFVTIKFDYKTQKYRSTHEKTNPTFELVAQGHQPKAWNKRPEKSKVIVRFAIQIEFIRDCSSVGPQLDLPNDEMIDLGMRHYRVRDSHALTISTPDIKLKNEEDMHYCDYYKQRQLQVYIKHNNKKIELSQTAEPRVYSIDNRHRRFSINASQDNKVDLPGVCQLWKISTTKCTIEYFFRDSGLDGLFQEMFKVTVEISSECYHLLASIQDSAKQAALWSWPQSEQDKMAVQYRLRQPEQEWKLPALTPPRLRSGKDLQTVCGPMKYDMVTLNIPNYYTVVVPSDYKTAIQMKIETADETIVIEYKQNKFERDWINPTLRATFPDGQYPELVWTNPFTLFHKVSDYCLGWTISQPSIKIENEESVTKVLTSPPMLIERYILAYDTIFDFSFLHYTQLDTSKVDVGCGNLVYKPHIWTNPPDVEDHLFDQREHVVRKDDDYIQKDGLRFVFKSNNVKVLGPHSFFIEVYSDVMVLEPHFMIEIVLKIEHCYVRDLDFHGLEIQDFELQLNSTKVIRFQDFSQVPLCNYTHYYSVTVFYKPNGPESAELDYKYEEDGKMYGNPPLVIIDTSNWLLTFDGKDEKLLDKTYQVFVTKHIFTKVGIQPQFFKFLKPFDVTVVESDGNDPIPNNAPRMDDFLDSINLKPGVTETIVIGKPFDIENNPFILKSWSIVEGIVIPWVSLNAESVQTAIAFTFSPPEDASAMKFTIKVKLADLHPTKPASESYETTVTIDGDQFVFDFKSQQDALLDKLRREKEAKDSFVPKKLDIQISKPGLSGLMKISFGAPLALPANVADWNADNEGGSVFFSIQYRQSDESLEMLEYLNKKMTFTWSVHLGSRSLFRLFSFRFLYLRHA